MAAESSIVVEVVYARADEQRVVELAVAAGTTALQAVHLSGLLEHHAEIERLARIGIHGRVVPGDTVLRDGDRVEIYRALIADPGQARRRRAARQR